MEKKRHKRTLFLFIFREPYTKERIQENEGNIIQKKLLEIEHL